MAGRTPHVVYPTHPAANPFPKVVYGGIDAAFRGKLTPTGRATVVKQAATTDQVIIAPVGTCGNGVPNPATIILGMQTQGITDSYGLTIAGGPGESDATNVFTQNTGASDTSVILGWKTTKGVGARKLPWISGIQQGDGITDDPYGTYPYVTPDGASHAAPGSADPVVSTPRVRVKLAETGATAISGLAFGGDPDPVYGNLGLAANCDGVTIHVNAGNQLEVIGSAGSFQGILLVDVYPHGVVTFWSGGGTTHTAQVPFATAVYVAPLGTGAGAWLPSSTAAPYTTLTAPVDGFYRIEGCVNYVLDASDASDFSAYLQTQVLAGDLTFLSDGNATRLSDGIISTPFACTNFLYAGDTIKVTSFASAGSAPLTTSQQISWNQTSGDTWLSVTLVAADAAPDLYPYL